MKYSIGDRVVVIPENGVGIELSYNGAKGIITDINPTCIRILEQSSLPAQYATKGVIIATPERFLQLDKSSFVKHVIADL